MSKPGDRCRVGGMTILLPFLAGVIVGTSGKPSDYEARKAERDRQHDARMSRYAAEDERRKKLHAEIRMYAEQDMAEPVNKKPTA